MGLAKQTLGFFCASGLPYQHPQGEGRIGQGRTKFKGASQRRFGLVEAILLLERNTEVVKRFGIAWFVLRQCAENLHGTGEIALVHQRGREIEASSRKIRVRRDDLSKDSNGLFAIAFRHQRETQTVQRLG